MFTTEVEWSTERLEGVLDDSRFDLLKLMGGDLSGHVQWELSVRDSPRFEDGELVFVMRDYEDVILQASLDEGSVTPRVYGSEVLEVWGGMEGERVSFRRFRSADTTSSSDTSDEGTDEDVSDGHVDESNDGHADESSDGHADEANDGHADEPSDGHADEASDGHVDEANNELGEWSMELPKRTQLKEAGLLGLQPRVDLAAFAPREDLDVGDHWDVPAEHLEELLFPVGHPATLLAPLGWATVADADVPEGGALDSTNGVIKVTLLESNERSGLTRMLLEIDSELVMTPQSALAALGQVYADGREFETGLPFVQAGDMRGGLKVQLKGEGELVWNRELHAFESLALPLDFTSTFEIDFGLDVYERHFDVRIEADGSGHVRLSASR